MDSESRIAVGKRDMGKEVRELVKADPEAGQTVQEAYDALVNAVSKEDRLAACERIREAVKVYPNIVQTSAESANDRVLEAVGFIEDALAEEAGE